MAAGSTRTWKDAHGFEGITELEENVKSNEVGQQRKQKTKKLASVLEHHTKDQEQCFRDQHCGIVSFFMLCRRSLHATKRVKLPRIGFGLYT